jgi:aminobenzoyl-glutamate utilization protein B
MNLWHIGDNMAKAATLMTDTDYTSRLLGSAWPGYFNKPIAEDMYEEHQEGGAAAMVGRRSDAGQGFAALS